MAQRRRPARRRKASQGPALKRCLPVLAGVALAVLALFGVGEYLGLPLPGWDEIGRFLGVYEPIYAIEQSEGAATRVHFIDAGQADATLIEQDGEFALIDAGLAEDADELIVYLDAAGVDELSYLVMTHPHADHMGGMDEVLQAFRVEALLLPTLPEETAEERWSLRALLTDAEAMDVPCEHMDAGDEYPLGSGTLEVLQGSVVDENLNDLSPILRFDAPGLSCLFTGDGESAVENAALAAGLDLRADLFKAGHHGSYTSNSRAFLSAVRPRFVVVSCGKDNDYGHPHEAALLAFDAVGAQVYRTDERGNIVAYVDGKGAIHIAADVYDDSEQAA